MRSRLFVFSIIAGLLLSGCGGVRTKTDPSKTAAFSVPHRQPVCLLAGAISTEFRYAEIGRIKATKRTYGSVDELPAAMADEARKIGADAIINMQSSQKFKSPLPWRIASPTGDGTAIKFATDSPPFKCVENNGRLM